ncbi:MAG: haloacid dehalogenase [Actinobacteria bacterium]|nr:MAG: haloacid dehalogenase [Actinomycetota bacterium]
MCASLDAAHQAREKGLAACRRTIRASGTSIRAVHRGELDRARSLADDAESALREAQAALRPHPAVAFAGFLHDAEKEYSEARLTGALVGGDPLPDHGGLGVEVAAWLNGLAEAASELRRNVLDRMREGDLARAEVLVEVMDDVYGLLITVDYPDALTGGLRRTTDALRAVVERTRGDLTTTLLQSRLQQAIERDRPPAG